MQASSSNTAFGLGLGIGLGLPSTMHERRSPRLSPQEAVEAPFQHNLDLLFPFSSKSRHVSAETVRVDNLVSYWSPLTDNGEEFDNEDEEAEGEEQLKYSTQQYQTSYTPESEEMQTPSDDATSPVQVGPHACLHMLSPKLATLAKAATEQGATVDDAISTALEWAWLVPMLDTSLPQQATVQNRIPEQAPAMAHMPSLASLASSLSLNSDNTSSSYQNDMARSHSLISSFSVASFSTAASSVASTSKSVLERKRPIAARITSTTENVKVIKLRSRTSRTAIQGEVHSHNGLTRRDTKMSVVSQKASIHSASPTMDELECMMFEPMQQLPSPSLSGNDFSEACYSAASEETSACEETRAALFEIWTAAEEAERQRKQVKRQSKSIKRTRVESTSTSEAVSKARVQSWVSRVRKSASVASLKPKANKNSHQVDDPVAWAEQSASQSEREEDIIIVLEPREQVREVKSIEHVLSQERPRSASRPRSTSSKPEAAVPGHIWDFLG